MLGRRAYNCFVSASIGYVIIISIFAFSFTGFQSCDAQKTCNSSSCGNLVNISWPFRLSTDPPDCGDPQYNLSCENNRTVLHLYSGKYYVETISYENRTMRVVDSGLQIHNCSSLPLHSLTKDVNFTYEYLSTTNYGNGAVSMMAILGDPYFYPGLYGLAIRGDPYFYPGLYGLENYIVFLSCDSPIKSTLPFVSTSICINASSSDSQYSYVYVVNGGLSISEIPDSCTIGKIVPIGLHEAGERSYSEIHHEMAMGFDLSWYQIDCSSCHAKQMLCLPSRDLSKTHVCVSYSCKDPGSKNCFIKSLVESIIASVLNPNFFRSVNFKVSISLRILGYMCLFVWLIYKIRQQRRHLSLDTNIEEFLQEHNNLSLLKYSYLDIKKMTRHFKDKLGKGGFGSVYKGKLRSGNLVAVKMLENSKGNGQDFINEVATIGRIHHVNVVRLVGFCFKGSKRALVYEFMPNGSLDSYIFSQEQKDNIYSSSWEKMYKIALGVAHGIEYLHRGCDMQILHFDIKPHNVLLDEDYTPKISDFGLAKLYPANDNTITMTAARGTIGYIAPELFYKSMGGVSFKADVYSFGMLLMDMVGRRKNVNPFAESSGQFYFPSWIYDKLTQAEDLEMKDATDEDIRIARKLIIVAISCIQWKPVDRPSMSKVIEMLESATELLQMPPKPFLTSSEREEEGHIIIDSSSISESSSYSHNYSASQSNQSNDIALA